MRAWLALLLCIVAAPAWAEDAPASDPASAADEAAAELPRLRLEGCRGRFARGDLSGARVCYETAPSAEGRAVGRRVAGALARAEAVRAEAGPSQATRLGDYVLGGKAELVATSTAYGAYLGVVSDFAGAGVFQSLQIPFPGTVIGTTLAGTAVLVPLLTGGVALAGSAVGTWVLEDMTPGQANLVRAALWLAAYDASLGAFVFADRLSRFWGSGWWRHGILLTSGFTLGVNALVTGGALTAAALLPEAWLPGSAGSLGLSVGAYAGVLTFLGLGMTRFSLFPIDMVGLMTLMPNLGFLAGVALAPLVPMNRYETWLMDGGAVVGGLLATAIVIGAPAGNPVVGYGGIGAGVLLGAGAAVAAGKLIPLGIDAMPLPDLVAVAPMVVPPAATATAPGIGVQVGVNIERLLRP